MTDKQSTDLPMSEQEQLRLAGEQLVALASRGLPVDVDPDIADFLGAFEESALGSAAAIDSLASVDPDTGEVISAEQEDGE